MKIYFAAMIYNDFREGSTVWNRLTDREKEVVRDVKHVLDSYHYIGNDRMVDRIRGTGRRIFLDSGAFSAFTQGVEIDIRQYCQYVQKNNDIFEVVSVLDAIGDPVKTYHNLKYMEEHNIPALPCFHYGEDEAVVEFYASEYDYITLGGMVPISPQQLRIWLDRIWGRYLTNPDGTPKVRVHGFGMTSVPLMARYPWYSVDSSSWVQMGGLGNIFLPQWGTLSVSEHAPQRKEASMHIDNLPEPQREAVIEYIEGLGFEIDRMRTSHLTRKVWNLLNYGSMMEAQIENKRFIQHQPVLF